MVLWGEKARMPWQWSTLQDVFLVPCGFCSFGLSFKFQVKNPDAPYRYCIR